MDLNGDTNVDAYSFEVKNHLQSTTLTGISIEVDGEKIQQEMVEVELSGRL